MTLIDQSNIGREADKAYNAYLKGFFDRYEVELLQKFRRLDPNQEKEILDIKKELLYIDNMKSAIESEIVNGKFADNQLKSEQNG